MSDTKPKSSQPANDRTGNSPRTDDIPPAGPHDKPELIDKIKTPGSGMLPEEDDPNESPTG